MGDFGDILDMFSNDDDENKKKKQEGNKDESSGNDIKSQIINKITKNKAVLISVIVAGTAILGGVVFFVVKYIGASGIKNVIDNIKPLTE